MKKMRAKPKNKVVSFDRQVPLLRIPGPRAGLKSVNPLFRLAHWGRFQAPAAPGMN